MRHPLAVCAEVVGASINGHGRLVVFITTVGADTALASIVRALQRAQGSKAPIQRLADRISAVFVPVVLVLSALTFVGWWVVGNEGAGVALLNAITVLIIACPCALGLATPVAVMAGTGRAAELGVLFKGGSVFESARRADLVLLDADPLADITNTTTIRAVVANGRYYDRAALDGLNEEP